MKILKYKEQDIEAIVDLFIDTVHEINQPDYTTQQLDIWAPPEEKKKIEKEWRITLRQHISYIAKFNNKLIGFADLNLQGQLKRIYVHKNFIRTGVATKLIEKLEGEAYELGLTHIKTNASITAVPFFKAHGYKIVSDKHPTKGNIPEQNVYMEKEL